MTKLIATPDGPVTVYYCKAGIKTGRTCRVAQSSYLWDCKGVKLSGVTGEMEHDNSNGRAKRTGARCVLILTAGEIEMIDGVYHLPVGRAS